MFPAVEICCSEKVRSSVDVSLFPWWLVLLTGLWVSGLVCWVDDRSASSWRNYAAIFCLAYTVLLWSVLTAEHKSESAAQTSALLVWSLRLCAAGCLSAAFALIGPVRSIPRWALWSLLGLSLAGICVLSGKPILAGCVILGCGGKSLREFLGSTHDEPAEKTTMAETSALRSVWLTGCLLGVLGVGLLSGYRWGTSTKNRELLIFHPPIKNEARPADFLSTIQGWLKQHAEFPWIIAGIAITAWAVGSASRTNPTEGFESQTGPTEQ